MAQRLALAFLAAAALLILLFSFVGGGLGAMGFAVVATAFPFALMALAVAGGRRPRAALLPIGMALLLVELSIAGMLAFRGRVPDGPWIAGLPLAAALQIYGVFLLPLAVTALGFALTFRRFEVTERDLIRLRELAANEKEPTEEPTWPMKETS